MPNRILILKKVENLHISRPWYKVNEGNKALRVIKPTTYIVTYLLFYRRAREVFLGIRLKINRQKLKHFNFYVKVKILLTQL